MSSLPSFVDLEAIAEVITELSHEIEALGVRLCRDPAFAAAHITDLQAIDLVAQKQRGIVEILRAECPVTAAKGLGLDELKSRFTNQRISI